MKAEGTRLLRLDDGQDLIGGALRETLDGAARPQNFAGTRLVNI